MSNLTEQEKSLIGKIDEMLTQLKGFGKSLWELREHASLVLPDIAPVDTKEGFGFCVKAEFSQVVKCSTQCEYCEQRERNLSQQGEQPNQIKEEVKDRYGINVCANHSRFDVRVYGIETESQANELKEKIKALLATL